MKTLLIGMGFFGAMALCFAAGIIMQKEIIMSVFERKWSFIEKISTITSVSMITVV